MLNLRDRKSNHNHEGVIDSNQQSFESEIKGSHSTSDENGRYVHDVHNIYQSQSTESQEQYNEKCRY